MPVVGLSPAAPVVNVIAPPIDAPLESPAVRVTAPPARLTVLSPPAAPAVNVSAPPEPPEPVEEPARA